MGFKVGDKVTVIGFPNNLNYHNNMVRDALLKNKPLFVIRKIGKNYKIGVSTDGQWALWYPEESVASYNPTEFTSFYDLKFRYLPHKNLKEVYKKLKNCERTKCVIEQLEYISNILQKKCEVE